MVGVYELSRPAQTAPGAYPKAFVVYCVRGYGKTT
jgi:hypothetical protein